MSRHDAPVERPSDLTPRDFEFDVTDNKFNMMYTVQKVDTTPDISHTPGREENYVIQHTSYVAASL